MNGLLALSVPATTYPVSVNDLKAQLRIGHDEDDILLASQIEAACQFVEEASGQALLSQTWKYSVDCAPLERLMLPKHPVTAIIAIDYFDADNAAQSANLADFTLYDSGADAWVQPVVGKTWPSVYSRPDAISVTFTAGGAASRHKNLRQAALKLAAEWYENPQASSDKSKVSLPFGVTELINLSKRNWIAA